MNTIRWTPLLLALALPVSGISAEPPQVRPLPIPGVRPLPGRLPGQQVPQPVKWGEKQIVVSATITDIKQGPTSRSFPPIYNHTLTLKIGEVLRGGLKKDAVVQVHHAARQEQVPVFPKGPVVVALSNAQGNYRIDGLEAADAKQLADIKLACELPLGWSAVDGKLTSPWAAQKERAWPKAQRIDAKLVCSVTGRPALLAGADAAFAVEKVAPAKAIEFTNPDGDGEYKITVTNPTDKPLTISALRTDGKRILWKESLVILCQGKAYSIPGSVGLLTQTQPVVLKPGESLDTVINALELEGPEWPRGGYRIEFQFCLGEKSASQSFYYMSRHHDLIRNRLKKEVN